jgi:regulatory protein
VPFKKPKQTCNESALYEYAIGALSRKMRTVAELKRLLRRRCPEEAVVSSVIIRLKDHKYLSDSAYAAAYAALRRDNQKFGSRRVITDLKVKGVHTDVIQKAVGDAYAETNELAQARAFLKRKRLSKPGSNQDAARIFRTLMRAGFGVSTSIRILKNWDVEDEVLTALQEESDQ